MLCVNVFEPRGGVGGGGGGGGGGVGGGWVGGWVGGGGGVLIMWVWWVGSAV